MFRLAPKATGIPASLSITLAIMLRLKYTTSDGTEAVFDLDELPAVLGRHPRAALVIDNPGVSREHARLFKRGEAVLLADLNSSNGTYLNGKKVSHAELKSGDEIRLGRAVLTVESCGAGDSVEPAIEPALGPAAETTAEPTPEPALPAARDRPTPSGPEIFDIDDVEDGALPAAEPARIEGAPRRAPPAQRPRPATASPTALRGSGVGGLDGIRVKDGLLQYNKISADKKASLLRSEFVQHHPFFRTAAIVIMLALAVGSFFIFKWLTEKAVPAPWEGNQESIESEMDEDF